MLRELPRELITHIQEGISLEDLYNMLIVDKHSLNSLTSGIIRYFSETLEYPLPQGDPLTGLRKLIRYNHMNAYQLVIAATQEGDHKFLVKNVKTTTECVRVLEETKNEVTFRYFYEKLGEYPEYYLTKKAGAKAFGYGYTFYDTDFEIFYNVSIKNWPRVVELYTDSTKDLLEYLMDELPDEYMYEIAFVSPVDRLLEITKPIADAVNVDPSIQGEGMRDWHGINPEVLSLAHDVIHRYITSREYSMEVLKRHLTSDYNNTIINYLVLIGRWDHASEIAGKELTTYDQLHDLSLLECVEADNVDALPYVVNSRVAGTPKSAKMLIAMTEFGYEPLFYPEFLHEVLTLRPQFYDGDLAYAVYTGNIEEVMSASRHNEAADYALLYDKVDVMRALLVRGDIELSGIVMSTEMLNVLIEYHRYSLRYVEVECNSDEIQSEALRRGWIDQSSRSRLL